METTRTAVISHNACPTQHTRSRAHAWARTNGVAVPAHGAGVAPGARCTGRAEERRGRAGAREKKIDSPIDGAVVRALAHPPHTPASHTPHAHQLVLGERHDGGAGKARALCSRREKETETHGARFLFSVE